MGQCWFSRFFCWLASAICCIGLCIVLCTAAEAQVTGTFSPGVYNEYAYGPLPTRPELASPTPASPVDRAEQLYSDMNQSRRPYISNVFAYTNQSLVNIDNHLDMLTNGVEFGFFPTEQTQVKLDYLPTLFGLGRPLLNGQEYRATLMGQPTNRLRYYARLGLFHTFHNVSPALTVLGGVGASYALTDRISVNAGLDRYIIGLSRLSATGLNLPISNDRVGPVTANQISVGTDIRPTSKTDLAFNYTVGYYKGRNIETNPFQVFNFRVGRNIIAREPACHLAFLSPSYQFLALGFQRDQSGFGNLTEIPSSDPAVNEARLIASAQGYTSLPNPPGTRQPGVGGYFSPQLFYLNMLRLDAGGRLFKHVFYRVGGGLGPENFRDDSTILGHTGLVGVFNASVIARVNRHITLEQGAYYLQAANTYRRYVLYSQARYYF
jgi:hypothetical protein